MSGSVNMMLLLLDHGADPNKIERNYKITDSFTYIENTLYEDLTLTMF